MDPARDPLDAARLRVADRLRALAAHLATGELGVDELDDLEALLAPLTPEVGTGPASTWFGRAVRAGEASASGHDRHPFGSGQSAVFPPLTMVVDGSRLVASTRLGAAWEGPPGLVHGGFLAAAFDMACSTLAAALLGPSVTRTLTTRYLRPTFLDADLRYEIEAGPIEGRLVEIRGRLFADDAVTLRGSAQFASLDAGRYRDRRPG
ncbi:PaaI family thioesterase [Aquihabitans daechungensis]|uniref:PaaI family thioesterase n=1 Tax=Aquihabitans daechungensis TaxID=1052257 RepID=UPI003BA1B997